ncbi:MAG: amino acid ABC transporter ATP-binding protein [Synergistaceae bacterium]|nr:amino acid ABC transporter ATP-binding protein [Synergistaceae bacterium]
MIEIKHLRKKYGDAEPIKDICTTIKKGEVVSIIGPSGVGKSTFLRMINMLETPTSGQILIDGEDITKQGYPLHKLRRKVGMVFQHFNLFDHMTVIENVCYAPIVLLHEDPKKAYEKGMKLLEEVGLVSAALKYPDELSGGQKQRVAIVRTLAVGSEIILFDEPTSALDPTMVNEVETVISQLSKKNFTMILVTHDMRFAQSISTRVMYLDEGGIYEEGTPSDIFQHPKKPKTIVFIKQLQSIEFELNSDGSDFLTFYTQLRQFANKMDISHNIRDSLQVVFEELVFNILIPKYKEQNIDYNIHVAIGFSPKDDAAGLVCTYNNLKISIDDEADSMPWKIIKGYTKKIEQFEEGDGNQSFKLIVDKDE